MPFKSQKQRAYFRWAEAAGKLAPGTADEWERHTPKGKKLPERVGDKKDDGAKKAFVAAFLLKCAAAGVTDPEGVAAMAEKVANASELLGKGLGLASLIPVAGLVAPPLFGYGAGALAAGAKNQMDTDDTKTLQLAAQANAYRRRAAEAKTQAEVRKLLASDPRKYVVLS